MGDQEVILHNTVVLYWPVMSDQEVVLHNTVIYTDW
jgi:hypothetical protein